MYKFEQLPKEKLAWLAGLFQSEAHFYLDIRSRSLRESSDYEPPPVPSIKIEMIEKDVMEHVADCLEQNLAPQTRPTSAGNKVYRVNISARAKVEAFLKAILPYTVGEKKRREILELLTVCEQYNQWVAAGGLPFSSCSFFVLFFGTKKRIKRIFKKRTEKGKKSSSTRCEN
jgi:hypothetical protein